MNEINESEEKRQDAGNLPEQTPFSLEEAFDRLDQMIDKLSDRETPLEETFETYRAGMELLKKCEQQIDMIEKKVMVLNEEGGMDEL